MTATDQQPAQDPAQLLSETQKQLAHEINKKKIAFDFIISTGRLQEFKDFCTRTEQTQN